MQHGLVLSDPPASRALLDGLLRLELVGGVEMPLRCNLSSLFPRLQHFHIDRRDLATGASDPPPVQALNIIEEMAHEQMEALENVGMEPMAAAC